MEENNQESEYRHASLRLSTLRTMAGIYAIVAFCADPDLQELPPEERASKAFEESVCDLAKMAADGLAFIGAFSPGQHNVSFAYEFDIPVPASKGLAGWFNPELYYPELA